MTGRNSEWFIKICNDRYAEVSPKLVRVVSWKFTLARTSPSRSRGLASGKLQRLWATISSSPRNEINGRADSRNDTGWGVGEGWNTRQYLKLQGVPLHRITMPPVHLNSGAPSSRRGCLAIAPGEDAPMHRLRAPGRRGRTWCSAISGKRVYSNTASLRHARQN